MARRRRADESTRRQHQRYRSGTPCRVAWPGKGNQRESVKKMKTITRVIASFWIFALLLSGQSIAAPASDIADAVMNRNRDAVRSLLQKKVDVNAPQLDGTTALHWAVRADDLEIADLLIRAGANLAAVNREGVIPMQLAALNGSAIMIEKLIKAGANPNAPLSKFGNRPHQRRRDLGRHDGVDVGGF